MHRDTFIEKLREVQQAVEQLLAELQASEHDKFAAHLYRSRRTYRNVQEAATFHPARRQQVRVSGCSCLGRGR